MEHNSHLLGLIRSERDTLLKKNAKAKERLLDLTALRQEKVKLEQALEDVKKKAGEAEQSMSQLKQKNKELLEAQKRKVSAKTQASSAKGCPDCKAKEKETQSLEIKLARAEKETLEVKNEKMETILLQRDIEDRLRDRERDFQDRENQLKRNAAKDLHDLSASHQAEKQKLRKELQWKDMELIEERRGHEEHVRLTE